MRARGARGGSRWTMAALAVATAVGSPPAWAQQPDTISLTLDEALHIAETNNPAYRRSVNQLALNPTETRNTWLNSVLPRTELTLFNTGYSGNIRRRATNDFGNPVANPDAAWQYFSNTSQAFTLSWNVQGNNLFNALGRQRETNQARDLAEERALVQARSGVRRLFYQAQEQREVLDMEVELEEQRRVDLELTERLFSLAQGSRVDVLNAELGIRQQALSIRQQRARHQQALLALRTVLGDPDLPPFRLAEEPVLFFDPAGLDPDRLAGQASASNPGVLEVESAERLALLGVEQQKNRWWPNLGVFYRVGRVAQTQEGDALFDVSYDEDLDHNFAISLNLPFFNNWFQSSFDVQRAEVDWDNARERVREAHLQVEQAVRSAILDLENQHESLRLVERSLEIAREALGLAREEYRLGARTFEQLQASIEQEALARRQLIEARYLFVEALVTLEEVVGAPVGVATTSAPADAPGGR